MTQVYINEQTPQGKGLLSLIKTMPKKVVTVDEEDDLSDCISSEEFGDRLITAIKKKYADKKRNQK